MMKKNFKKYLLLTLVISLVALPKNTFAITLKEYEDKVAKYTKEYQDKQNKIAKSKEEVEQVKKNIANIESQIKTAEDEIKSLEDEIDKSNKEIENKKEQSKKIMKYFQIIRSGNTYLEYIFEAESVTDMIYRISVVEQLTEYNQKVVKELNELISQNKVKKAELAKKNQELSDLKSKLESEKARIEQDIEKTEGTLPSTKDQIAQYQTLVNYYKNKGCKSNDVIGVTCAVSKQVNSSSGNKNVGPGSYIYPINGGRFNRGFSYNPNTGSGHKGWDISVGCGTPIYAIADGTVFYTGNNRDKYGAYMVMIDHGNGLYSQYAHVLSNIPVSQKQRVSKGQVIAYVGSTGYSTGCHLHLELSAGCGWNYPSKNECYYGYYSDKNPFNYLNHLVDPDNYIPR